VRIGVKKIEIVDHPRKRQADLRWADQEEDEDEYVWQKGQWCPLGLRKSQKRRVQRLRNRELRQAGIKTRQVWRPKDKPEGSNRLAPACMVYFLPNEFMAPANQVVQEEASLLLGWDWIHANCCVPSTMHQQLIQWVDDDIEVVQEDDSVSVANVEPAFREYQGIDCFSGKDWGEGPIEPVSSDQQPIQAVGSYSNF
jgi:hypothetical protein